MPLWNLQIAGYVGHHDLVVSRGQLWPSHRICYSERNEVHHEQEAMSSLTVLSMVVLHPIFLSSQVNRGLAERSR